MLLPGAIVDLKIHKNVFAAMALLRTPLGDPLAGIQGARCGTGGEGRRKVESSPTSFFYNLTTDCSSNIHRISTVYVQLSG